MGNPNNFSLDNLSTLKVSPPGRNIGKKNPVSFCRQLLNVFEVSKFNVVSGKMCSPNNILGTDNIAQIEFSLDKFLGLQITTIRCPTRIIITPIGF